MKVLIADKLDARGVARLQEIGCSVVLEPSLDAGSLPAALTAHSPSILVVRSTKVSAQAIEAGERLQLIVRAGAGYDNVDVASASAAGVFVANCPGKNAIAVAELAWALILCCDRQVPAQTAELRAGDWNKKRYGVARGIYGRRLGVLGVGRIAREVIARAHSFGMPVVAWSRSLTEDGARELGVSRAANPVELARQSDVLTVHLASTRETQGLVSREVIDALPDGAFVINTSRGAVVDEAALLQGIRDKGLRAGLDVYQNEPKSGADRFQSELAAADGVCGTHHIGASTDQAQQAIALEAALVVDEFLQGGRLRNCVNRAARSSATCTMTVRHRNRPGVLAQVFQVLSEASINVEEMENLLYQGAETACAQIRLSGTPTASHLEDLRGRCDEILSIELAHLTPPAESEERA